MSDSPKPWAPHVAPRAQPAPPLPPVDDARAWQFAIQQALSPRHGMTTAEGWLFDPWMFRWIEATRLLMHKYRVSAPR